MIKIRQKTNFADKKNNLLNEMFGTFKFKKSTKKLMIKVDREIYNI